MAHEFFAHVLEKPDLGGAEPGRGRFRSYLLGALKHHLSHRRERAARQKRGGGVEALPLTPGTDTSPGVDPSDVRTLPPDREFDRQWAMHVLKQAMASLQSEWHASGKAEEFALLQPMIAGEPQHGGLAALADARGLNASSLRKTLSRLRQRFRHHVKAAITPTLAEGVETDDEMRELLAALSP
jgi:RNA polymerase sigma-70 factor (ECF subfamily)